MNQFKNFTTSNHTTSDVASNEADHEAEIVVVGASTRAACWSLARAGKQAVAYDLFADLDFPPETQVHQISSLDDFFSRSFDSVTADSSRQAMLFPVGGWENLPPQQRIQFLEHNQLQIHPVWANSEQALTLSRDPFFWTDHLARQGLPFLFLRDQTGKISPELNTSESKTADTSLVRADIAHSNTRSWIRKSKQSVAGLHIRLIKPTETSLPTAEEFDQQQASGTVCSAQFLGSDLLGCTRLLSGCDEVPENPFLYSGNLFPLEKFVAENTIELVDDAPANGKTLSNSVESLGKFLAEICQLTGLWGLDFVLQEKQIFPLEINPRYTAAMELIELAEQRSLLEPLVSSKIDFPVSATPKSSQSWQEDGSTQSNKTEFASKCLGKQILYSPFSFQLPADWNWNLVSVEPDLPNVLSNSDVKKQDLWQIPVFTDLAKPGTHFRPGDPICTIWSEADSGHECQALLQQRKSHLLQQLRPFSHLT